MKVKFQPTLTKKHIPSRSWNAGRFERMSLAGNSHPIVTRGSRVSRAPPHHTLSAFLNVYGSKNTHRCEKIFLIFDRSSINVFKLESSRNLWECQNISTVILKLSKLNNWVYLGSFTFLWAKMCLDWADWDVNNVFLSF